jgi:hypothetical protein
VAALAKKEKMNNSKAGLLLMSAVSVLGMTACGGGGSGDATLSGSLSGLAPGLSVALQVNAANDITLTGNQAFSFPSTVSSNRGYKVSVLTQPVGQTCSIPNGSGYVDSTGNNVSGIAVACVSGSTLYGTVTGLAAGGSVTLNNNGAALLAVSANGAYGFPGTLAPGSAYAVTVGTQPAGQICSVANATGTVGSSGTVGVDVSCVSGVTIGGTVSGLVAGTTVTLSNNGATLLPLTANGAYGFPGTLVPGSTYAVTVSTQPTSRTCSVANARGTVGTSTVIGIDVSCV